jgi:hypothetical protein
MVEMRDELAVEKGARVGDFVEVACLQIGSEMARP